MSYSRTVALPVGPDEAFALVTEPERLRRWQTVTATVDLRAGGGYRWTVVPGHVAAGTFREIEPGRRVVLGWGWADSDDLPPDASTLTITVEPAPDGGSVVTLVHEGLTEEQAKQHAEGWDHYLDRLQRVAATGEAGLDEWTQAPDTLDPFVAAEAALSALQPVLRGLTQADRPKETPCADFDCHQLVEHLITSLAQLGAMAGVELETPQSGSAEDRVSVLAGGAIEAWRQHDLQGNVAGDSGLPASFVVNVLPLEIALHGWDLAQSTGRAFGLSDAVADYLRGPAEVVVPNARGHVFADEAVAADGASSIDRLAAFAGRTPLG